MRRKLLVMLMAVCITASLVACGTGDSGDKKVLRKLLLRTKPEKKKKQLRIQFQMRSKRMMCRRLVIRN